MFQDRVFDRDAYVKFIQAIPVGCWIDSGCLFDTFWHVSFTVVNTLLVNE